MDGFICGCGHSGTTLIANILNAHPDIFVPARETRMFQGNDRDREYWIARLQTEREQSGKRLVFEKTPRHIRSLGAIRLRFPEARFVIPVRDGRDVVASLMRRVDDFDHGLTRWVHDTNIALRQRHRPDVYVYRHEDLVHETDEVLRSLCAFIGVEFDAAMLRYHEQPRSWIAGADPADESSEHALSRSAQAGEPIRDTSGRWKRELTGDQVAAFRKGSARMLMAAFAYAQPLARGDGLSDSPAVAGSSLDRTIDRTVFLHLGLGRCGSGSIQQFAQARCDSLAERGVLYPSALEMGFDPAESTGGNGRALVAHDDADIAIKRVVTYLSASDAPRVLISAEQLTADPALLDGLANGLRSAGLRVVALAYLRDQREWLVSRWAQGLKSDRWPITLDEWMAELVDSGFHNGCLDYLSAYTRWSEIFGPENLIVRPFSPQTVRGGDVRLDLFGLLDIDVSDLIEDAPTVNASVSLDEVVAMRILNTLPRGPTFDSRPFLRYAEHYAALKGWERRYDLYRLVPPERMRAIAEHYAPLNEQLRVEACPPDTPAPLLASSIPDDYEPLSEDDVVTTRSMTLVASFLTWYAMRALKKAEPVAAAQ